MSKWTLTIVELKVERSSVIIIGKWLLEFDITGVLGSKLISIDFYNTGVEEAYVAIKNKDDSTALSTFKNIKITTRYGV